MTGGNFACGRLLGNSCLGAARSWRSKRSDALSTDELSDFRGHALIDLVTEAGDRMERPSARICQSAAVRFADAVTFDDVILLAKNPVEPCEPGARKLVGQELAAD